ncbi:MAG: SCO6880 family protein, partial [Stackebrandtia sp.]
MTVYTDYSKARIGHFFGLTAWQLATIALATIPVFAAIQRQAWLSALALVALWLVVAFLVCWPVRGRSATGW